MATIHPPLDELPHLATKQNAGEQAVFDRLVEILDDHWHIFVQPHVLNLHPDFLICAQHHGVTVIEVKDWTPGLYRNRGGRLEVRDKAGDWWPSDEDPMLQVHRYRQLLEEHLVSPPGENEFRNVRGTVVLPQFDERELADLISGTTELDEKERPWIATVGRRALTDRDAARRLVYGGRTLGGSLEQRTFKRLLDRLEESEASADQRKALPMSKSAMNVARNPNSARIRRVRGPAGSGKTLGLAARGAHLAAAGQSVLVLTFNITLAHYVQDLVRRHSRRLGADSRLVDCTHFHGFCSTVMRDNKGLGALGGGGPDAVVDAAIAMYENKSGRLPRYDAVLVDEGQDFKAEWWNFLRRDICRPEGELLLAADVAQDLYDRCSWTAEDQMLKCGFSGPWTELKGSYRLPADLIPVVHEFASTFLQGADLQLPSEPPDRQGVAAAPTKRRWVNSVEKFGDPQQSARVVADEVERMLGHPTPPKPADVVVLTNNHLTGTRVMEELSRRGIHVESIFATDEEEQRKRKNRFWPGVNALKGSTVHSFKGWEARGVVIAIEPGRESHDAALAYVALSRVKGDPNNRSAFVTVVNADPRFAEFKARFEREIGPDEVPALGGQLGFERLPEGV